MKIYAIRHGQTDMNIRGEISGVTDVDINAAGVAQAQQLAARLQQDDCGIQRIICSPMRRARHTAEILAERLRVPIHTDARLTEQNYGVYEGKDRLTEGFRQNKSQFAMRYPGGESTLMVGQRVYNFLDELRARYADETVLLVTHGGVLRLLRTYFTDMTNDELLQYLPGNAEPVAYEG